MQRLMHYNWGRNAESYFAHLLNIIYSYCDIGCFAICGDFNSRIGDLNDSRYRYYPK